MSMTFVPHSTSLHGPSGQTPKPSVGFAAGSQKRRILPGTGSRTPSDDWELAGGAGGSPAGGRWDSSPFGKQRHTEVGCWMSDLLPGAPVSHSKAGGWTGSPGPLFLCSHQLTTSPLRDLFCLSWPMTQLLCKEGIVSYSGIRG